MTSRVLIAASLLSALACAACGRSIVEARQPADAGHPRVDAPMDTPITCMSAVDFTMDRFEGMTGTVSGERGSCGGNGPELALVYTATRAGRVVFSTIDPGTTFDTVLYVRSTCEDAMTELGCNDDAGGTLQSSATVDVSVGTVVYVFVDGLNSTSSGTFVVTATFGSLDGGTPSPDAG